MNTTPLTQIPETATRDVIGAVLLIAILVVLAYAKQIEYQDRTHE